MNMKPADWNAALAPSVGWQEAYAKVESAVRVAFDASGTFHNDTLSTGALVEALYPEQFARGEGITARRRIFKALAALADHGLAAYVTRGEPQRMARTGKTIRPRLWHKPRPVATKTCPHCGGSLS